MFLWQRMNVVNEAPIYSMNAQSRVLRKFLFPIESWQVMGRQMVEGEGFEPSNAYAGRFTVCCH